MSVTQLETQKRKEATARYDNLNRRIEAVDHDISSEVDGERLTALREKRADLAAQRDAVAAELAAQEKRSNGDLEILQRKVSELGRALASDRPAEAHAIIEECANALTRLDSRVLGLEGRVTAIEQHIHPPIVVTILRVMALAIFLFAGTLFWIKETREVLFGAIPWAGIATEGALILAIVAILLLANAQMEKTR